MQRFKRRNNSLTFTDERYSCFITELHSSKGITYHCIAYDSKNYHKTGFLNTFADTEQKAVSKFDDFIVKTGEVCPSSSPIRQSSSSVGEDNQ